jgi:hypothetical protein
MYKQIHLAAVAGAAAGLPLAPGGGNWHHVGHV